MQGSPRAEMVLSQVPKKKTLPCCTAETSVHPTGSSGAAGTGGLGGGAGLCTYALTITECGLPWEEVWPCSAALSDRAISRKRLGRLPLATNNLGM